jgi:hypothetical protein
MEMDLCIEKELFVRVIFGSSVFGTLHGLHLKDFGLIGVD